MSYGRVILGTNCNSSFYQLVRLIFQHGPHVGTQPTRSPFCSNKLIHLICVPVLLWTAFAIFSYHEIPRALVQEHAPAIMGA